MVPMSMGQYERIWLESFHKTSNIEVFAMQDRQLMDEHDNGQTWLISQIHMLLIWIKNWNSVSKFYIPVPCDLVTMSKKQGYWIWTVCPALFTMCTLI